MMQYLLLPQGGASGIHKTTQTEQMETLGGEVMHWYQVVLREVAIV